MKPSGTSVAVPWPSTTGPRQQRLQRHAWLAGQLGVPPGTLAFWEHRWQRISGGPALGPPCSSQPSPSPQRGHRADDRARSPYRLAAVQAAFPTLARREARTCKPLPAPLEAGPSRLLRVLHWHQPGAVWAMDHADPPRPIDGRWPHILAVRDLASGCNWPGCP